MLEKKAQTNFSKGELSAFVGARPDLAAYFGGASIVENLLIYPEGGATNEGTGLGFITPTKFSATKAILVDFVFNVTQVYKLEIGHGYTRIHDSDWVPLVELETPWQESDLPDLQWAQSADILNVVHPNYQQRQINRFAHTDWSVTLFAPDPPPSFVKDTDISGGTATLTPAATTGVGINFHASGSVFLAGDVGRHVKYGLSRGIITSVTDADDIIVRIISDFPDTNPIPAGEWLLTGSPGTTLDPTNRGPVGAIVNLVSGVEAFRADDVLKYITIWGGVVQVVTVTDPSNLVAIINTEMSEWDDSEDPDAALSGTWTLEVPSWSEDHGYPSIVGFHQGRLFFGATDEQPTTVWLSASDDYANFGKGVEADSALEYTIASRRVNRFQWGMSLGHLFVGDAEQTIAIKGPGVGTPLGGDTVPFIDDNSGDRGCVHSQPVIADGSIFYVNRFRSKLYELSYVFDTDSFVPKPMTLLARQISDYGFAHHRGVYAQEPNESLYWILDNGQLGCLTFNKQEQVRAWSRIVTDGVFESVCVTPGETGHEVSVIVRRTINGATVRYIEQFSPGVYTHSSGAFDVSAGDTTIGGFSHLAGKTVNVTVGGSFQGTAVVSDAGVVTFPQVVEANAQAVIGLPYTSTLRTMKVAAPNNVTLGHKRHWADVCVDLYETLGGTLDGEALLPLTDNRGYTGPVFAHPTGGDYDGYLTLEQNQPYPFTVLGLAGKCSFADDIG